jgi:hypothetical protein
LAADIIFVNTHLKDMGRSLVTILLIIGAAVLVMLYLRPQWDQFQVLRTAIIALEETSAELDDLTAKRDTLISAAGAIPRSQFDRIGRSFPEGPGAPDLVVLLETLAQKNGVLLRNVDAAVRGIPQRPRSNQPVSGGVAARVDSAGSGIKEIPLTMSVTGTYDSFKSFLQDLERSIRIIDVVSISFSGGDTELINVSIRAKAYFQ